MYQITETEINQADFWRVEFKDQEPTTGVVSLLEGRLAVNSSAGVKHLRVYDLQDVQQMTPVPFHCEVNGVRHSATNKIDLFERNQSVVAQFCKPFGFDDTQCYDMASTVKFLGRFVVGAYVVGQDVILHCAHSEQHMEWSNLDLQDVYIVATLDRANFYHKDLTGALLSIAMGGQGVNEHGFNRAIRNLVDIARANRVDAS